MNFVTFKAYCKYHRFSDMCLKVMNQVEKCSEENCLAWRKK